MFRYIEDAEKENSKPIGESRDLGFMLYDIDYNVPVPTAMFFRAEMKKGVVVVPGRDSEEVRK